MPVYEYRCDKCGQFELFRRITATPLKRCPTCKGAVSKLISPTAFQFKGTGWYVTDYARKDGAARDGSGKDGSQETSKDAKGASSGAGHTSESGGSGDSSAASNSGEKGAATGNVKTQRSGRRAADA